MNSDQFVEAKQVVDDKDYELFAWYTPLAFRTMSTKLDEQQRGENIALGLVGEIGELVDIFKKHEFHGHPLDTDKVVKECGDVLWYLANAMYHMNTVKLQLVRENITTKRGTRFVPPATWRPIRRAYLSPDAEYIDLDYKHPLVVLAMYGVHVAQCTLSPYPNRIYYARTRNSIEIACLILLIKSVLHTVGSDLETCMKLNVEKLKKRYPEGFSAEDSLTRKDMA